MDTQIVAVYCLCEDLLKALYHSEDPQCQMSDAEVMTARFVAAKHKRFCVPRLKHEKPNHSAIR